MRTLGDSAWLNDYIGLPYVPGARGPDAFDCYGLVKLIYDEQYGEILPDWLGDHLDLKQRSKALDDIVCGGTWTDTEDPADGDIVICYRTRAAYHIGLFYAGGVIHSLEGVGVIYEPLARFEARFTRIVFGEWHP